MSESKKHTACPACQSERISSLKGYDNPNLFKCEACKFIFTEKIPSAIELDEHYSNDHDLTSYFSPITRKRYEELLERYEPFRKTNRILDIGCGYGFFLEVAKEKGWEVYGTEIMREAIDHCHQKDFSFSQ